MFFLLPFFDLDCADSMDCEEGDFCSGPGQDSDCVQTGGTTLICGASSTCDGNIYFNLSKLQIYIFFLQIVLTLWHAEKDNFALHQGQIWIVFKNLELHLFVELLALVIVRIIIFVTLTPH